MVSVSPQPPIIQTDRWVRASWAEFEALFDSPTLEGGRFYYDRGRMRIEMPPIGSSHGQDDPVVSRVVSLYATANHVRFKELGNASFRKTGEVEFQPDIAYYIGAEVEFPARGTAPIDLAAVEPPTLAIEIASTSLNDDLGQKRLLYEQLRVREYWVVDVQASEVIAFEISEQGRSGRIQASRVLPGLQISVLEEALKRSQAEDDGAINRWLLEIFAAGGKG
ncbi:Uma2 family endonuclease [Synechococcus sp. PCC 7336]|uniref:Uma2 family endonuclease n=1 Tax=Synechococcus sp. PCC 7336 TaxID=195250 RepID=UPI0003473F18|nr:Uma2 family endonuclease [Synechococcus sp. PCC 7336]